MIFAKAAWDSLPADLRMIAHVACLASVMASVPWSEAVNGEALSQFVTEDDITAAVLPPPVVERLREVTMDTLSTLAADPMTQKVHDSHTTIKTSTNAGPTSAKARGVSRS